MTAWRRADRIRLAAERIRERHPRVVLHLRDVLVPHPAPGRDEPAFHAHARVPGTRAGTWLVVATGAGPGGPGRTVWHVRVAAFRARDDRQLTTPAPAAEAWARAVFGDPLDGFVVRDPHGAEWPWPGRLRRPMEQFLVHLDATGPVPLRAARTGFP
ncbi:hypothetical protein WY02_07880 [Pseudonocardia sp. AL041005-10]|nr:hypothetical protein [Pseudonocardia sp. AL041005-10]ALE78364.1 hypothetical protein WY02_07880 [Pseudonocardia sp. AL041005-10]